MSDALTGDEKIIFAEVGTVTLLTLLFVSVLLCTLAVVWILRRNSNRWLMKSGQKKRGAVFAVMFGLALAVTGCSGRGKTGSVVYNSSAGYDCMGYEIIRDAGNFDYSLKKYFHGETYPLARSLCLGYFLMKKKYVRFICVSAISVLHHIGYGKLCQPGGKL